MKSNAMIGKAVRVALVVGVGAAFAAPAAFGQGTAPSGPASGQNQATPTPSPAATTQSQPAVTQLGKVEVTGTLIPRTEVETAQPITVITAKQIRQSGFTTIGDILTNITQASAGFNLQVDNSIGEGGQSQIDLRYFGSQRVLVLVNGKRWMSNIDGTVDLNSIPAALVDHIEILQDGASAIYGSDAITGVVNIITVKDFNGAEADAFMGAYDGNGIGGGWDGKTQNYSFTMGDSTPRGGLVFSASYTENNGVWASNRAYSNAFSPYNLPLQTVNAWFPRGRFIVVDPGVANLGQATPSANGTFDMTLVNAPTSNPTLANFRNMGPNDLDIQNSYLLTPNESKSIYISGHYDLADNLTFTTLAQAIDNTNFQWLSPAMVSLGSSGFILRNNESFGIGGNNPYNPFHQDLVSKSSQWCPSGTLATGPQKGQACQPNKLLVLLGRNIQEGGPRSQQVDNNSFAFRMGLNGFFDALGSEWDWNLNSNYGQVNHFVTDYNMLNTVSIASGLDAPGFAQCNGPGQATNPGGDSMQINGLYYPILLPGCVPLNVFGGYNSTGYAGTGPGSEGSITPAMLKYIMYNDQTRIYGAMRDYTGTIVGNLFNLPAGPLQVALGAESLENDAYNQPSGLEQSGNAYFGGFQPTNGREWTNAEYIEINVPLLANLPLVKALSLDIANRWSQFSWAGGEQGSSDFGVKSRAHATTGQAKLLWNVTDDLLFRGSWAQGFRVPNISELFAGQLQAFPFVQDPCAPSTQNGNWNPSTPLPAGCHGVVHQQLGGQIRTLFGSNPHMTPETAISRSAGFVYSPSWIPGFDIGADYYKIDLGNVIGSNGAQFVLNQCFLAENPQYCGKITMVGNQVSLIDNLNTNTGEAYSRGTDVSAHYRLPATAIGTFMLGTTWTFVQSFVNVTSSAQSPSGWQSSETRGFAGIPQRRGQASVSWNFGNWSAAWNIDYIGPQWTSCSALDIQVNMCTEPNAFFIQGSVKTKGLMHIGTTIYHDPQITYHSDALNTNFTFGIQNIFNKLPPTDGSTALYRIGGRFVYGSVGVKF